MPDLAATPLSRRTVVAGVGAGACLFAAGCSSAAPPAAPPAAAAPGTALGPASEVPVGGAKIYPDQGVVVTQAAAGDYAGFSAVCPHQGCAVSSVEGSSILCLCHGSAFALDGSVTAGPAQTGLESRAVTLDGEELTLA